MTSVYHFSVAFWNNWILRSCWITKWRKQKSADQEHVPLMLSSPHTREKKVQVLFPFWWFLKIKELPPKKLMDSPCLVDFPLGKCPKTKKKKQGTECVLVEWGKRHGKHWETLGKIWPFKSKWFKDVNFDGKKIRCQCFAYWTLEMSLEMSLEMYWRPKSAIRN